MGGLEVPRAEEGHDLKQSMTRVRSLGLPAVSKARIAKSLYSVGLYRAETGGMSVSRMNDVHISARKALGKGANLRRSSPLELMAYGGVLFGLMDPEDTAATPSTGDVGWNTTRTRKSVSGCLCQA
eukprot:5334857-Amphidinium_carterae.4